MASPSSPDFAARQWQQVLQAHHVRGHMSVTEWLVNIYFYGLSGSVFVLPMLAAEFWYVQTFATSNMELTIAMAAIVLPWCHKPLFVWVSARYPVGGYHRRPYIVFPLLVATALWMVVVTGQVSQHMYGAIVVFYLISFCTCMPMVMMDLIMFETIPLISKHEGTQLLTLTHIARGAGELVAGGVSGVIIRHFSPQFVFEITAFLNILLAIIGGFMPEPRHPERETVAFALGDLDQTAFTRAVQAGELTAQEIDEHIQYTLDRLEQLPPRPPRWSEWYHARWAALRQWFRPPAQTPLPPLEPPTRPPPAPPVVLPTAESLKTSAAVPVLTQRQIMAIFGFAVMYNMAPNQGTLYFFFLTRYLKLRSDQMGYKDMCIALGHIAGMCLFYLFARNWRLRHIIWLGLTLECLAFSLLYHHARHNVYWLNLLGLWDMELTCLYAISCTLGPSLIMMAFRSVISVASPPQQGGQYYAILSSLCIFSDTVSSLISAASAWCMGINEQTATLQYFYRVPALSIGIDILLMGLVLILPNLGNLARD